MTVTLTENEVMTVIGVFSELERMNYSELNSILGSMTIADMWELNSRLKEECCEKEDWEA